MNNKQISISALLLSSSLCAMAQNCDEAKKPNVVIIYADDLGYGDVGCYNKDSKIPTPNIDKLASNGIMFTDAHSPSSISGPSRYSIITGCYSWRTPLKSGNPKTGEQLRVEPERLTIASLLKENGYNTAAIGKWGLGANWEDAARPEREGLDVSPKSIDYSKPIPGAQVIGFTYEAIHRWFGHSYYSQTYPCHDEPTTAEKKDGTRWYFENGMSKDGDPQFEKFDMEEAQMYYIEKAVEYVECAGGLGENENFNLKDDAPFFLYYAPHIPHYPHVPAKQFQGTTGVGLYGDFVYQLDWAVGRIVEALEKTNQLDNTIILFASDNGPELQTYKYIEVYDHRSMNDLRGVKRDLYQGGHTTPFIVSYNGVTEKGKISDRLVSQTDIIATVADLIDVNYNRRYAEDSFSFIDEIMPDKEVKDVRDMAIHHSADGELALRYENWVFIMDKTGSCTPEPSWFREELGAEKLDTAFELFDLDTDPAQTRNVIKENPEVADKLRNLLFEYVYKGRTASL
ncbi:MAG: arylsulfatase [Rikenellaceae bacterium]